MRSRAVLLASGVAIVAGAATAVALAGSSSATATSSRLPLRLAPNAMAFLDSRHGVLGTGWPWGNGHDGGTIELTSDGGRTWKTVAVTPRPVVSVTISGSAFASGTGYIATYDDGETLRSHQGRIWQPKPDASYVSNAGFSPCPLGMRVGTNTGDWGWSVCTTQASAGAEGKAVYRNLPERGWVRVACTEFAIGADNCPHHGYGGISSFGYASGIAGSWDGFGLIWEDRGTLYVTRDGGRKWIGLDKLIRPDMDFVGWGFVLHRHGVGWALVNQGGNGPSRLLWTADRGRTWTVVHRWPVMNR